MKLVREALFVPLLVVLSACGGSGSGSDSPQDLRAEATKARPLSQEQKSRLAKLMAAESKKTPDTRLYFDKNAGGESLKALDADGLSLVKQVRANCNIDPGPSSLPSDNTGKLQSKTRTINGAKCPISYSEKTTESSTVKADPATLVVNGRMRSTVETSHAYVDAAVRKNLFVVDSTSTMANETVFNNVKMSSGKLTSGSVAATIVGSSNSRTGDGRNLTITFNGNMSMTPDANKTEMLISFRVPDFDPIVIGIFVSGDSQEIFLNGEPYTADRLKSEFGSNFGTLGGNQ